jgi:hypothetical protein
MLCLFVLSSAITFSALFRHVVRQTHLLAFLAYLIGSQACAADVQARQHTKWLSGILADGFRLPTEAECEYAARTGTTRPGRSAAMPQSSRRSAATGFNSKT